MAAILQEIYSNWFSEIKIIVLLFKYLYLFNEISFHVSNKVQWQ